ncbi:MAG: 2,3-bisphosphoglycerate-independent phosphoglycerate mutase [Alphaproteobacteria bacterium]
MSEKHQRQAVVLCILDGWGQRAEAEYNAIAQARTPVWDRLMATCPHSLLEASSADVGLPGGQFGNSEVGHMNIGAGRIVLQTLPRIDRAIEEGKIASLPALREFIEKLTASGGTCHILGLISPAGVHAHQNHAVALARIMVRENIRVRIHGFLDGRDTPPESAEYHFGRFLRRLKGLPRLRMATMSGRYYAMDRDRRWERTTLVYDAVVKGWGQSADDPIAAILENHALGISDEFVKPTVLGEYEGMRDGDGVIFTNYRADRIRQIAAALLDPEFDGFPRDQVINFAATLGMAEYSQRLNQFMGVLFPSVHLTHTLGEVVAEAGLNQLRIAETEKYAHVTFFFSGGQESKFPGEERILIPSPKVATYDLKPEMSAAELTDRLVEAIEGGRFGFIVVNYANPDMVGHTGDLNAAVRAIETTDACVGRVEAAVKKMGGILFVTADHGNAEIMRDTKTGQPHTSHTHSLVPAVLVNGPARVTAMKNGRLADIAPSLLTLMGLKKPSEMTGHSLLVEESVAAHANAGQRASA